MILFRSLITACALGVAVQVPAQSKPIAKKKEAVEAFVVDVESKAVQEKLRKALELLRSEEENEGGRAEAVKALEEALAKLDKSAAKGQLARVWREVGRESESEGDPARRLALLQLADGSVAEARAGSTLAVRSKAVADLLKQKGAIAKIKETQTIEKAIEKADTAQRDRLLDYLRARETETERKSAHEAAKALLKLDQRHPDAGDEHDVLVEVRESPEGNGRSATAAKRLGGIYFTDPRANDADADDDDDDDDSIVEAIRGVSKELRQIRKLMERVHGRLEAGKARSHDDDDDDDQGKGRVRFRWAPAKPSEHGLFVIEDKDGKAGATSYRWMQKARDAAEEPQGRWTEVWTERAPKESGKSEKKPQLRGIRAVRPVPAPKDDGRAFWIEIDKEAAEKAVENKTKNVEQRYRVKVAPKVMSTTEKKVIGLEGAVVVPDVQPEAPEAPAVRRVRLVR
ncbi:MAG: hypothetical protein KDC98_20095 [Planctomycetes bacterium]|nr:hypothetical protein [Planctomycetota bacterium]